MKLFKRKEKNKNMQKKYIDFKWVITITTLAFLISLVFSLIIETTMPNANVIIASLIILLFIFLGMIFDMIGVAVAVADINTFNSMSAKKVKGSKLAVVIIKNASKAATFCNDVIGDICGVVSGGAGIALATIIADTLNINVFIPTLLITALIAALTIGSKALGKSTAMNKSTKIVYNFSKFLSFFIENIIKR